VKAASKASEAWKTCRQDAFLAGKRLADVLSTREYFGNRPITLIGYSVGATVVLYCLLELRRKQKLMCITNAVVIGLPHRTSAKEWRECRDVVAGRLVNCFSPKDCLLSFICGADFNNHNVKISGLEPIDGITGLENFDMSQLVRTQTDTPDNIEQVLLAVWLFDVIECNRAIENCKSGFDMPQ